MDKMQELKKLLEGMSPAERQELLAAGHSTDREKAASAKKQKKWFDRPVCGLDKDGCASLQALEEENSGFQTMASSEKKRLHYLRMLKKMKLKVPDFFRRVVQPRALYQHLKKFCQENDLPEEVAQSMIPSLISYMETGHMRPVLFVGEKGCGKTTTAKRLLEEALKLPVSVIKIPQMNGGHGMTGDSGVYASADAGCIARARLRANNLLVGFIFDEIDKVAHDGRLKVDDELLSVTDASNSDIFDNFLEANLVGLEYCPMTFTANDLSQVNPILADRCTVIHFPSASAERIKSITKKYADSKLKSSLYRMIRFDYKLMDQAVDELVSRRVTSLRKHQQMIEKVLNDALNESLAQEKDKIVPVTRDMFASAERAVLGSEQRKLGF